MLTALKMFTRISTILIGLLLKHSESDITLHTEKKTWPEARAVCSQDGRTLISDYNQDIVQDLLTNISTPVWEGRYLSPWAWLLGCYRYQGSFKYTEFKNNQKKDCVNHCNTTTYFGLQGSKCYCFDTFFGSYLRTIDYCKYICPGNKDERCGGVSALTVYMNDICYKNSSQWQGTVSQTWSGKQCLPWASVINSDLVHFPDGSSKNASNYCRDPFKKSMLGCFINQAYWEQCVIPPCIKARNDGVFNCMSFKKPESEDFQFKQESCERKNYAACTDDSALYSIRDRETWRNALNQSRHYEIFAEWCKSLAGPRIFLLYTYHESKDFQWFGLSREICLDSKIVPNRNPQKCYSVLKENETVISRPEDCNSTYAFICQNANITCGESFNNSLQGSFETPRFNQTLGYGDLQRCVWTITVPENFNISLSIDVSIENSYMCRGDFIRVFEDRFENGESFCGETVKTMNSSSNTLTIEFRSDETISDFRGAQVIWSAVPVPTSPTTSTTSTKPVITESNTATTNMTHSYNLTVELGGGGADENFVLEGSNLAGVIRGGVVAVCLVVGFVLFLIKRCKKETKSVAKADLKVSVTNFPSTFSDGEVTGKKKRPSKSIKM